jgi:acetoin utilization deacetylase AcuC-like enzyme
MGFCLFNNVAVAARYAQKAYGVERVLIVDWDVHHGNGTQDIFYSDPSVFFFSVHQAPWYPGTGAAAETGEGAGKGTTLNCPLPAGAGHAEVFAAFRKKLVPAALAFKPDLILVSAGFDSRRGDPLGRFLLKDSDFAELTAILRELADRSARRRIVSLLEGGYNLDGFAKAVVAHIQDLQSPL